jgi:uncharacterized protein (DUF1810 family)
MNFDLDRFVTAQDGVFEQALDELQAGRKRSHWMWFVFPQVSGLGRSETARFYAIASLAEARAFLDHPLLGKRLERAVTVLNTLPGNDAAAVFGGIDSVKLRSSLTLFREAGGGPAFDEALEKYFEGAPDPETLRLLRA